MGIIGTSIQPVGQHSTNSNTQNGKSKDDNTQLWKKGPTKKFLQNGKAGNEYFTITNLYNQKVLTAVEGPPASLEIKGKPKETHYSSCQMIYSFLQISIKSVVPLSLFADFNTLYSFQMQILYKFLTLDPETI